jgi:hypothetical protein
VRGLCHLMRLTGVPAWRMTARPAPRAHPPTKLGPWVTLAMVFHRRGDPVQRPDHEPLAVAPSVHWEIVARNRTVSSLGQAIGP